MNRNPFRSGAEDPLPRVSAEQFSESRCTAGHVCNESETIWGDALACRFEQGRARNLGEHVKPTISNDGVLSLANPVAGEIRHPDLSRLSFSASASAWISAVWPSGKRRRPAQSAWRTAMRASRLVRSPDRGLVRCACHRTRRSWRSRGMVLRTRFVVRDTDACASLRWASFTMRGCNDSSEEKGERKRR